MEYFIYFLGVGIGFALGVYWSTKFYDKQMKQHFREYHGGSE